MASASPHHPKRRSPYRPFHNADNAASPHSELGLPALVMLLLRVYIKAGGHFLSYQFTSTCVLDSVLAALHICYIKHPNVKSLLESNESFDLIMTYLNREDYDTAKAFWLRQLKHFPKNGILDCKSRVQDHLPMFAKLVCAEVDYRQETPDHRAIFQTTLSKFRALGDVKALGQISAPALILVNRDVHLGLPTPPLSVEDDNQRIFELQFLLLGQGTHMVMCFNLLEDLWILYDNELISGSSSSFRLFNFDQELSSYVICLAGYVNTTQAEECKRAIPETGTGGTQPFDSSSSGQQSIPEDSMEDILMRLSGLSCAASDSE